jgi:hypothetical protein
MPLARLPKVQHLPIAVGARAVRPRLSRSVRLCYKNGSPVSSDLVVFITLITEALRSAVK